MCVTAAFYFPTQRPLICFRPGSHSLNLPGHSHQWPSDRAGSSRCQLFVSVCKNKPAGAKSFMSNCQSAGFWMMFVLFCNLVNNSMSHKVMRNIRSILYSGESGHQLVENIMRTVYNLKILNNVNLQNQGFLFLTGRSTCCTGFHSNRRLTPSCWRVQSSLRG